MYSLFVKHDAKYVMLYQTYIHTTTFSNTSSDTLRNCCKLTYIEGIKGDSGGMSHDNQLYLHNLIQSFSSGVGNSETYRGA